MLKGQLIHPEILATLGAAGHGSKVLIADGNYPFATKLGANAELVHLNLAPGIVDCVTILCALATAIPVESAAVMTPPGSGPGALPEEPLIWREFATVLAGVAPGVELEKLDRPAFYEAASTDDVALTIASGEQRIYANLLLTIGVVG